MWIQSSLMVLILLIMHVQMVDIMKEANTKANMEHKEFEQQLKKRRKVSLLSHG